MVREQEPARNPLAPSQARISEPHSSDNKSPIETLSSPIKQQNAAEPLSPQPTFGQPTALNNNASPLAKVSASNDQVKKIRKNHEQASLFSKRRPGELSGYHNPPKNGNPLSNIGREGPRSLPPQNSTLTSHGGGGSNAPSSMQSTTIPGLVIYGNGPSQQNTQARMRPSAMTSMVNGDRKPYASVSTSSNSSHINSYRPTQTFSSNSNTNPYFQPASNFADPAQLRRPPTEEEGFNDAHVFGNDRFGTADPMMYVDSKQADENIKALLEGALDDEEDKPRTRRQKKKLQKQADELADRLKDVKIEEDPDDVEEEEVDDGTREGLKVKLLPHQIDGVEWMVSKETSTKKTKGVLPHGGILADDMGLGKTIQALGLILANPRPADEHMMAIKRKQKMNKDDIILPDRSTLVVAPLALIKQWEAEINTRIEKSHALKVEVHHGPQRTKSYKELRDYDVVITTYQTLSSEHNEDADSQKSALFGVRWYRIILDEAHSIKNRNAKTTKAACSLRAEYRWCLTGTPLQNNLDELQSLIHFLRIKPYDDLSIWREQITKPLNSGRGGLSIRRLRAFLSAFMKRRTKDVLKLDGALQSTNGASSAASSHGFHIVKRSVEKVEAEFSEQERTIYERLEARTDKSLERMMAGNQTSYASVLVLLMRLRQACNHYQLLGSDLSKEQDAMRGSQTPGRKESKADDMDDIAAMLGGLSVATKLCDVCQIELAKADISAGMVRCAECEEDLLLAKRQQVSSDEKKSKPKIKAEHRPKRAIVLDSDDEGDVDSKEEEEEYTTASSSEEDEFENASRALEKSPASSTKIRHLLKILKHDSHTNKYIVFSFFTSMLDLIEPFLRRHNLKFVRYDGAMRNDAREASLQSLREKSDVRILLCSLRAGSLGLNLTAASRVVILEPFWNPFVEEQAIDRVHRLNQTQDVIVHKLTIKDTVEARILDLQEKKRELAKATIEGQKGMGAGKLTMNEMLSLFRHDAEKDAKLDMIGMKDGRSLLDRDSHTTQAPKMGGEARRNRIGPQTIQRSEDPVYGRRW